MIIGSAKLVDTSPVLGNTPPESLINLLPLIVSVDMAEYFLQDYCKLMISSTESRFCFLTVSPLDQFNIYFAGTSDRNLFVHIVSSAITNQEKERKKKCDKDAARYLWNLIAVTQRPCRDRHSSSRLT